MAVATYPGPATYPGNTLIPGINDAALPPGTGPFDANEPTAQTFDESEPFEE